MNKKAGIFAILLLYCCLYANGYTDKKAILQLSLESQPDTLGYNYVSDFATDAYVWIANGQVVLWDSPEKKLAINITDLKDLEAKSNALFTRFSNVFIYETWTSDKKKFNFKVKGFSFTGFNFKGEEVLFGFIEFNPALEELFRKTPLHINANGINGNTMYSALMNMGFRFTLIYFDKAPLVDYKNSEKIVKDALNPAKINLVCVPVKATKLVEYGWDSTDIQQAALLKDLLRELYIFFNQNKQEFFNYGGDKYYSYLRDAPILISDLHEVETWTLDKDGKLFISPKSIIVYTSGIRLQPIPIEKLDEWKLTYKGISYAQFLSSKDYSYQVKKINETNIPSSAAETYKNALFAGNWYHLLE